MPEMANFISFSRFPVFPAKISASIITGALTYANKRRYTTMKSEHEKYAAATKAYFTVKAGKTKVAQLTHGELFPSFTIIIGAHLTRKLISFYGSVFTVLDDDADPEAEGVNVVLGSTSNMTTRTSPAFVSADEVGKCHAIIRLAAAVPPKWRKHFPHTLYARSVPQK